MRRSNQESSTLSEADIFQDVQGHIEHFDSGVSLPVVERKSCLSSRIPLLPISRGPLIQTVLSDRNDAIKLERRSSSQSESTLEISQRQLKGGTPRSD